MLSDEPHVRVTLENIYTTLLEVKHQLTETLTENRARDRRVGHVESDVADLKERTGQVEQHRATRKELEQLREEQQTRSRWAIGLAVTAMGVLIAGIGLTLTAMRVWIGA